MINKFISALLILLMVFMCVSCTNTDNEVNNIEMVDTVQNEEEIEIEEEEIVSDEEPISDEELIEESVVEEEVIVEESEEPIEETTEETTEAETEEEIEEEIEMIMYFDEEDVIAAAKVLYNECRGVPSDMEKACVVWTACNRVDAGGYGDTIYEVLTAEGQFAYYSNTPVTEDLYNLALDVLTRWNNEKNGVENVGRVLPPDYMWFGGDGKHNYFRNAYSGNFDKWDYSFPNPYND